MFKCIFAVGVYTAWPALGVVTPLPKLTGCAAEKGTFLNTDFRTKGCDIKRPSVQKKGPERPVPEKNEK